MKDADLRKSLIPFVLVCLAGMVESLSGTPPPNVLFIVSDDLNYMLSGSGHPESHTPELDRFAQNAVSFTRAYAQFPLCSPSRASFMSGQYPDTNGVVGNGGEVAEDRVTLPRHFRNHGYWTSRVSKIYHMGVPGGVITGEGGLDHAPSWDEAYDLAALETLTPGIVEDYGNPEAVKTFPAERKRWLEARRTGVPFEMTHDLRGDYAVVEVADEDEGLLPDTMATDRAIEILRERAGRKEPFFLAVGYLRPHFPFVATESSLAPFHAEALAYPHFPANDYDDIPPQAIDRRREFSEEAVREIRRGYLGAVRFMDRQFGRLLAELDRLKLRDNTIVVFVSDHGYLLGEHQMWKKNKLWEEAIRVPLLISTPGLQDSAVCHRFVELVDLYPTLAELAGLPPIPASRASASFPCWKTPGRNVPPSRTPSASVRTATACGPARGPTCGSPR
jgi:iduronate 2-sulfatase